MNSPVYNADYDAVNDGVDWKTLVGSPPSSPQSFDLPAPMTVASATATTTDGLGINTTELQINSTAKYLKLSEEYNTTSYVGATAAASSTEASYLSTRSNVLAAAEYNRGYPNLYGDDYRLLTRMAIQAPKNPQLSCLPTPEFEILNDGLIGGSNGGIDLATTPPCSSVLFQQLPPTLSTEPVTSGNKRTMVDANLDGDDDMPATLLAPTLITASSSDSSTLPLPVDLDIERLFEAPNNEANNKSNIAAVNPYGVYAGPEYLPKILPAHIQIPTPTQRPYLLKSIKHVDDIPVLCTSCMAIEEECVCHLLAKSTNHFLPYLSTKS